MDPWTERQHTRMLPPMSMDPWDVSKKALHQCSGNTSSCLGPYPLAACPEFHVGYKHSRDTCNIIIIIYYYYLFFYYYYLLLLNLLPRFSEW